MMPRKIGLLVAGVVAVAVAVALVDVFPATPVVRSGGGRATLPSVAPKLQPVRYRGALVPATGAYLGADVGPVVDTAQSGIDAFQSFERELGGSLAIVHVYHRWGAVFPTSEDKHFVDEGKILLLTWGEARQHGGHHRRQRRRHDSCRAEAIKKLGHPIMIEFRHEMDRPNLQWTIHGPPHT